MNRAIFPYHDAAGAERWADPLAVDRRLRKLLGQDPAAVVADFLDDDPNKSFPAADRLKWAACAAFDLGRPFQGPDDVAGGGAVKPGVVLESVWSAALLAFVEWWEKNVLAASSSPTCSGPSPAGPPPTPAASSAAAGTTPPA